MAAVIESDVSTFLVYLMLIAIAFVVVTVAAMKRPRQGTYTVLAGVALVGISNAIYAMEPGSAAYPPLVHGGVTFFGTLLALYGIFQMNSGTNGRESNQYYRGHS